MTWPLHLPTVDDLSNLGGDFCSGIDTQVSSVGVAHETAPTCSPSQEWEIAVDVTLSSALEPDAELLYEVALDSGGTSWSEWQRTTNTSVVYTYDSGLFFGTDGTGSDVTKHFKARVSVVNKNDPGPTACHGPVESSQITRTEPSCTE
jgi:hypothetical protein